MRIIRKLLITACGAALLATPAWAHPGRGPSDPPRSHGRPHRCTPHAVAYVAAGTLVSQTLALDDSGQPSPTGASAARASKPTYSGAVTIDVARTNRHARADKGRATTYTLDHARVLLALSDQNGDGSVDLGDVLPGSRAKVIGEVAKLRRGCDQTGVSPQPAIAKLIVHAPKPAR